jgi:hypothetical protein
VVSAKRKKCLIEHLYLFKEKENRKPEGPLNVQHISSNSTSSGSLPKRYQSVFTEGTPLTSLGVRNDENYTRSHSVKENPFSNYSVFILLIFSLQTISNHNPINDHLNLLKNF